MGGMGAMFVRLASSAMMHCFLNFVDGGAGKSSDSRRVRTRFREQDWRKGKKRSLISARDPLFFLPDLPDLPIFLFISCTCGILE